MSAPRRRENDGAGKSAASWEKHTIIAMALRAQAAKAKQAFRGRGVIVDMHAHDGCGVQTPQLDLFGDHSSTSSAGIAWQTARDLDLDLILCERNRQRMAALKERFGDRASYLGNNSLLTGVEWRAYSWAAVLNDPNGHSEHSVDVLTHIAAQPTLRSDFIVMINEGSLLRHMGLARKGENDHLYSNVQALRGSRAAAEVYAWMLQPEDWRKRLAKRFVACSRECTNGIGYRGRLLLLTDSLANLNPEMFTW